MAIAYLLVSPERYKEAIDLFNDQFLPYNPLVGYTTQTDLLDQKVLEYLKQGLSWCAIDEKTGATVGVRIILLLDLKR